MLRKITELLILLLLIPSICFADTNDKKNNSFSAGLNLNTLSMYAFEARLWLGPNGFSYFLPSRSFTDNLGNYRYMRKIINNIYLGAGVGDIYTDGFLSEDNSTTTHGVTSYFVGYEWFHEIISLNAEVGCSYYSLKQFTGTPPTRSTYSGLFFSLGFGFGGTF